MDDKKVVLGMSGGVDSAAAAIILKEKGYEVTALYFDVLKKGDVDAKKRAEDLCQKLNIELNYVNLWERFEKVIIEPFCESYALGCTPMPCISCNPYIKWWALRELADEIGAKWLSTGHYSKIVNIDDVYYIKKSSNKLKDQSYMLAGLDQSYLSRIIFPLENYENKDDVKAFVKSKGLEFPESLKESQDICFVPRDYRDFLKERNVDSKPGNFVDEKGNIIGTHKGHTNFTIGQRKGLGMGFGKPMYVKSIDADNGNVMLCEDEGLYHNDIMITVVNFAKFGRVNAVPEEYENKDFMVKIRYAAIPCMAKLNTKDGAVACLSFEKAQRAPAFGQYTVFYDGDIVIGCGVIS